MFNFRLKVGRILFCGIALFYGQLAFADIKIGFVDMQTIIEKSSAYKDISTQIDSKAEVLKTNATKLQEKLQKQYQELEAKKSIMSKEAYSKERKNFEAEAERSQEAAYMERVNLDRAYAEAIKVLETRIFDIVQNKAKSMALTAVFTNATVSVLYYKPELDITESVLEELNKSLTAVKVEFNPKKSEKINTSTQATSNTKSKATSPKASSHS